MKHGFRIMALLLLSYLLYPSVGSTEEASLKKIRTLSVSGKGRGRILSTDSIEDMRKFVFLEQLLFSAGLEYQTDLDNKSTERLRQEFEKNGIPLSRSPAVSIREKGSKWLIVDEQTYIVRKQVDKLSIYLETRKPIDTKKVSPDDEIFVKAGAHLRIEYKGHDYWYGYDTRVRIGQDMPELLEGEQFVKGKGSSRGSKILVQEAASEYYLKVESGGEAALYVIEGKVRARNEETGEEKTVLESIAIDESLSKLPDKDIQDIAARALMWRDHLKVPIGLSEWAKHYSWAAIAGATVTVVGIVVKEVFSSSEPEPALLNIYVESR